MNRSMRDLLVPHDPRWKADFEQLRNAYRALLPDLCLDIQHVGSTALPGVCAKPILDIDIVVHEADMMPEITRRLEQAGYLSRGEQGVPGRFAFRQRDQKVPWRDDHRKWPEHHLYVCLADSLSLKNHIWFRDMLLAHPELAAEYSLLKHQLASTPGMSRETYTLAKTRFILSVLSKAGFSTAEIRSIEEANR
jgi:GrpB-like predicted nucleotidyltransferase (UPF0157 family)